MTGVVKDTSQEKWWADLCQAAWPSTYEEYGKECTEAIDSRSYFISRSIERKPLFSEIDIRAFAIVKNRFLCMDHSCEETINVCGESVSTFSRHVMRVCDIWKGHWFELSSIPLYCARLESIVNWYDRFAVAGYNHIDEEGNRRFSHIIWDLKKQTSSECLLVGPRGRLISNTMVGKKYVVSCYKYQSAKGEQTCLAVWNLKNTGLYSLPASRTIASKEVTVMSSVGEKNVIVGTARRTLEAYDVDSGALLDKFHSHSHEGAVNAIATHQNIVVSASLNQIILWNFTTGERLTEIKVVGKISALVCTRNMIVAGAADGTVTLLDQLDTATPRTKAMGKHRGKVTALSCFDKNKGETLIMSGSADRSIKTWDLLKGMEVLPVSSKKDKCVIL